MPQVRNYDAVVFDLLTALIDSWTIWNRAAGSAEDGLRWRREYLALTYAAGPYRPYADIVRQAARQADIKPFCVEALFAGWGDLPPWPETRKVLTALAERVPLGVVTNCSVTLGAAAVACTGIRFSTIVTAESAGFYKPRPEPYRAVLKSLDRHRASPNALRGRLRGRCVGRQGSRRRCFGTIAWDCSLSMPRGPTSYPPVLSRCLTSSDMRGKIPSTPRQFRQKMASRDWVS